MIIEISNCDYNLMQVIELMAHFKTHGLHAHFEGVGDGRVKIIVENDDTRKER